MRTLKKKDSSAQATRMSQCFSKSAHLKGKEPRRLPISGTERTSLSFLKSAPQIRQLSGHETSRRPPTVFIGRCPTVGVHRTPMSVLFHCSLSPHTHLGHLVSIGLCNRRPLDPSGHVKFSLLITNGCAQVNLKSIDHWQTCVKSVGYWGMYTRQVQ